MDGWMDGWMDIVTLKYESFRGLKKNNLKIITVTQL